MAQREENPRWTRCRAALGREPKGYEFIVWISRRWSEFCALHACRDTTALAQKLGEQQHPAFDAWLAVQS